MATSTPAPAAGAQDPLAVRRSPEYVRLLVLAALLGVPIAVAAFAFEWASSELQHWLYSSLPSALGFDAVPWWWPIPLLVLAGLLVAAAIDRLPGTGGHPPAEGFAPAGAMPPAYLPGVILAALASLGFGAVLGPEAPLVALGAGLAVLAVTAVKKDTPQPAVAMLAAAGSFASVSTLLGSPLLGAFLLMEAAGIGGAVLQLVLVPGLLAAGVGALVFLGLGKLTGLGTYSLGIPGVPAFDTLTAPMFLWAIAFGIAAAVVGAVIRSIGLRVQALTEARRYVVTPLVGLVVALCAVVYAQVTGHPISDVLFSGEQALGPLITSPAGSHTVGALLLLMLCKAIAYAVSLGSFRGGPTFPAMFIGAALGVALADAPGLSLVPAVAMGLAAFCAVMLQLPLTSVLLATLFLGTDGIEVVPVTIVAVVVAYVVSARLPGIRTPEDAAAASPAGTVTPASA